LAYRGRSEKELRERLKQKGFDEQAIDTVIGSLISGGFLDDRKLASSLTRYATESKHYGITGTRKFLRERGIPRDLIDTTVKDIDETEIARKIVEKKMRTMPGCPPEKAARRLYAFLYRKGYSPETIKRALEDFVCREDLQ
jgi:regulatory protein